MRLLFGGVAEWTKATVLKTVDRKVRGFESYLLRHIWIEPIEADALGLDEQKKKAVNDDRIARTLEALASSRGRSLFFRLALRMLKEFSLGSTLFPPTIQCIGSYSRLMTYLYHCFSARRHLS